MRAIRQLLQASPFHGEGYRKLWARLRFAGIRTSRRRVLRLMREHGLLAHQRAGRPRGSKAHDGTITTDRVDLMWGTDLTSVMTGEGQAAVFVAVDHCSAECVGVHASRSADRFEALEPVRQAVRERFGAFAKNIARWPRPPPRSRHPVRQPPFPERDPLPRPRKLAGLRARARRQRLRRALHPGAEGEPLWVRRFDTVEELRLALLAFKQTYNQSWIIERHGYKTPAQVRADQIGQLPRAA